MTIAYDEHQQQHRDDGCKKHPPYSCSHHRGVDVVSGFGCNTSQEHVARKTSLDTLTVDATLNLFKWIHQLWGGICFGPF